MKKKNFRNEKIYKEIILNKVSNLRIVSMIPGDLSVAGCFIFLGAYSK